MAADTNIIDYAFSLAGHAVDKTVGLAGDAVGFGVSGAQAGMIAGAKAVTAGIVAATSVEGESYTVEPMIQQEPEIGIDVAPEDPFAQMLAGVDLGGMEQLAPAYEAPSGVLEFDAGVHAMSAGKFQEQSEGAAMGA